MTCSCSECSSDKNLRSLDDAYQTYLYAEMVNPTGHLEAAAFEHLEDLRQELGLEKQWATGAK